MSETLKIERELEMNRLTWVKIDSDSMLPLLRQDDLALVMRVLPDRIRKGDIVLFKGKQLLHHPEEFRASPDGLVLHRVVDISGNAIMTKSDHPLALSDGSTPMRKVLGRVIIVKRGQNFFFLPKVITCPKSSSGEGQVKTYPLENPWLEQIVLENKSLSVLIVPALGARILKITAKPANMNYLRMDFPFYKKASYRVHYGGIEDELSNGEISDIPWTHRIVNTLSGDALECSCLETNLGVKISKTISLHQNLPFVSVKYILENYKDKVVDVSVRTNADIAIGNNAEGCELNVATTQGRRSIPFRRSVERIALVPSEGWFTVRKGALDRSFLFGHLFPISEIRSLSIKMKRCIAVSIAHERVQIAPKSIVKRSVLYFAITNEELIPKMISFLENAGIPARCLKNARLDDQ